MKVVLLAGGLGTRLSEETDIKPKPMVEIGGKPMLWHIMKIYSSYGFNDFVVALGYKGYLVKEYFSNYFLHQSDVTIDMRKNKLEVHNCNAEPWKITMIDTGQHTMTGGRIARVRDYIGKESFLLTYGDGVSNVNIAELVKFHKKNKKLATITAIQPAGRFGALNIDEAKKNVMSFTEKPKGDNAWINGGFFVVEPEAIDYIKGDSTVWEQEPLQHLAAENELMAYKHHDFWKCMDTLRDKQELESLWTSGKAPWKIWK